MHSASDRHVLRQNRSLHVNPRRESEKAANSVPLAPVIGHWGALRARRLTMRHATATVAIALGTAGATTTSTSSPSGNCGPRRPGSGRLSRRASLAGCRGALSGARFRNDSARILPRTDPLKHYRRKRRTRAGWTFALAIGP
ncbi:hypothetical protein EDM68_01450 [Candidatus Uhrbacteria bacterium]|nr:MAG: hypothetical protein EDM68_01450 [Candidatus Uhrbacteria bacterium]